MYPGFTTKISNDVIASAATIDPKRDLIEVTGNTAITTIIPHFGPTFSGVLFLIPTTAGGVTLNTGGNIAISKAIPQNTLCVLVFYRVTGLWYPNITA